jgi:hypothetical protein
MSHKKAQKSQKMAAYSFGSCVLFFGNHRYVPFCGE